MWSFVKNCLLNYNKSSLFDGEKSVSYIEVLKKAEQHGKILKELSPVKTKCSILCEKGLNSAIAVLSCWYADLVPVLMSKNYGKQHCENIINTINPDIMIYDENIDVVFRGIEFNIVTKKIINSEIILNSENCLKDVAIIMCTSGTTGQPKGAMITEQSLIKNIESIAEYFKIYEDDKIVISRPLYHCSALTGEFLVSLYKGLDIGFFDNVYNPLSIIYFINQFNISVICGTPTLLNHISTYLKRIDYKGSIKKIAVSGECLSKKIAENIRSAFLDADIYNIYGLTEAAPRVSYLPPKYFDDYPEAVGVPLKDIFIKVVDIEDDNIELLCPNIHGKVIIKSPSIMKGYYNNIELSSRVINNGWLDTGDIGYKDNNGFLYIVSRIDDMIIKAGMNIYPKEIENAANMIDVIADSLVYRVRNDNGENIAIDIVLNENSENIDKKDLMKLFSKVLPVYQMPSVINFVDEIPKNASGKIIRRKA